MRVDREFKWVIGFYVFLALVSAVLLEVLAQIHPFSREFNTGFLPFLCLLAPYLFFSTRYAVASFRGQVAFSFWKRLLFPAYLLLTYSIFSLYSSNFQWPLFIKLSLWLFFPVLVFSKNFEGTEDISFRELIVILSLWLPIEFGQLPGFDIIFNKDVQIPALAFAAPALGLYLFCVLRNLPDVGYSFRLNAKDFLAAAAGIAALALLLVPLGTNLGFIRMAPSQTSPAKAVELILGIYFLVAIPEELLFRGIIQNSLLKILPGPHAKIVSLLAAAAIFGLSHWNNYNPPDWRYVFLATIAGLVYGTVYFKTGKTTASALVHCGVNFTWAVLFQDTSG